MNYALSFLTDLLLTPLAALDAADLSARGPLTVETIDDRRSGRSGLWLWPKRRNQFQQDIVHPVPTVLSGLQARITAPTKHGTHVARYLRLESSLRPSLAGRRFVYLVGQYAPALPKLEKP